MGFALLSADVGPSRTGYDEKVKAAMAAMRRKANMTQEEFAAALSDEINDGRTIRGHWVSRWESGAYMPKGDIVLSAMAVSGATPAEMEVNPLSAKAIRMAELHRQIKKTEYERDGKTRGPFVNRLDLPPADGDATQYVTAQEAADLMKVSRPHLYDMRDRGQLRMFRRGTRVVLLRSEVEVWASGES